ncbi:MAG: hypothetical protein HY234_07500 [Acidobacteria bacterium]|nr:hypothetical protein [Acidobacteriota bacterium]MBI3662878.1 hypothetical protein [Acidobacteriota bacterium]
MIAALILVIAIAGFLQFFVSYCRSLIAAYERVDLSDQAREVTGISDRRVSGQDFGRLLQLVRMCPEPGDDSREIGAVRTYFGLLTVARAAFRQVAPTLEQRVERERESCAYFAAVALDRRIAHSRDLMAQQLASH